MFHTAIDREEDMRKREEEMLIVCTCDLEKKKRLEFREEPSLQMGLKPYAPPNTQTTVVSVGKRKREFCVIYS